MSLAEGLRTAAPKHSGKRLPTEYSYKTGVFVLFFTIILTFQRSAKDFELRLQRQQGSWQLIRRAMSHKPMVMQALYSGKRTCRRSGE